MATVTKGFDWADGHQITSARLDQLVDSATVTNITEADMASGSSIVTISDNAPASPVEGKLWADTSPAAGEAILRMYNGTHWIPVGRGFLGHNTSGSTIDAGMIVKRNPAAAGTADFREEIAATTSRHDIIAGVALTQMVNGATGVVITNSRSLAVLTTGSITAGDPLVPSTTTGKATTGADANYGKFYGQGVAGVFTKTGSGASNEAALFQAPHASGVSFRTPVKLLDGVTPASENVWSLAFGVAQPITWSVTPPGVIARLIQWEAREVTAAASDVDFTIAFRQAGSAETIALGALRFRALFSSDGGSAADELGAAGSGWLMTNPAGDGTDRAEYLIQSDQTATDFRITVWEKAVMCGGRVV